MSATSTIKSEVTEPVRRVRLAGPAWALALTVLCIGEGCGSAPRDNERLTYEMQQVFGSTSSASQTRQAAPAWSIVLGVFPGPDGAAEAKEAAGEYRLYAGLDEVYVVERDNGASVHYGRYASPADRRAQRDLAQVRAIEVDGRRPFAQVFLMPPRDSDLGSSPQFALSTAKSQFGDWAIYTLQIGVYESEDRNEAKRLAEQAVVQLRREGELAFYHHGSSRSMVTIGVFASSDYNLSTGAESQELLDLRARHPYNLYNGMGLRERGALGERLQPSALVMIPDAQ